LLGAEIMSDQKGGPRRSGPGPCSRITPQKISSSLSGLA